MMNNRNNIGKEIFDSEYWDSAIAISLLINRKVNELDSLTTFRRRVLAVIVGRHIVRYGKAYTLAALRTAREQGHVPATRSMILNEASMWLGASRQAVGRAINYLRRAKFISIDERDAIQLIDDGLQDALTCYIEWLYSSHS